MKISKNHSTATNASKEIIKTLEKSCLVSKIGLGIIKKTNSQSGNIRIKFLPISGGIKAVVTGGGAVQDLYIYTKYPLEIKSLLKK